MRIAYFIAAFGLNFKFGANANGGGGGGGGGEGSGNGGGGGFLDNLAAVAGKSHWFLPKSWGPGRVQFLLTLILQLMQPKP